MFVERSKDRARETTRDSQHELHTRVSESGDDGIGDVNVGVKEGFGK
jgi:hypothetical protein